MYSYIGIPIENEVTSFSMGIPIVYYYILRAVLIACLYGSVAKASDTQAVGHGFDPRPDH